MSQPTGFTLPLCTRASSRESSFPGFRVLDASTHGCAHHGSYDVEQGPDSFHAPNLGIKSRLV